ncbi:MAG TPA: hypothetical protein VKZ60_16255 [Chloroflexota bacterium]|nr:hypothetical protein [Chloroflexota bacterium]
MPASPRLPYPPLVPPRTAPYTPLQLLFLSRLAHLAALCYYARHELTTPERAALVQHALRSTIDDCFAVGLAPELLALLEPDAAGR